MPTHLVQLSDSTSRRIALVQEPDLLLLFGPTSIYELAQQCAAAGLSMAEQARSLVSTDVLSYDDVYEGRSPWRLLSPIDVPGAPSRVLVAGTGLTHLGSARERQAMHVADQAHSPAADAETTMTDSMRMFQWGVDHGRSTDDKAGIAPEWFYKGDGSVIRAPFEPLEIPSHAEDGGEEAEVAGIYLIGDDGTPYRIGFTAGNEFSDHKFEKRNYLNLAGSKLRPCSLGPELVIDGTFSDVRGEVRIERAGETIWHKAIASGDDNMCHSLANLEHHHFKFAGHRQPGNVHVHFFGADALSFGAGIVLRDGDITEVKFDGFGRALQNTIREEAKSDSLVACAVPRIVSQTKGNDMTQVSVGLLGLGTMGSGMATNLLKAGFPLSVYNRTQAKAEPFAASGARVAGSPADAATGASVIVSMLSDDAASRAAWLGERGALAAAGEGCVLVEASTVSPAWIAELSQHAGERGLTLLDAPVTGSRVQAECGQLTFLVGGSDEALAKATPVLQAMSKEIVHLGPTGSGAKLKLLNNFLCGVQVASLAEGLTWLERSGLDVQKALGILKAGAPGSPLLGAISARMTSHDYTVNFLLRLMAKDLQYAADAAKILGVDLTTAANAKALFENAIAQGFAENDMSSVIEPLRAAVPRT